MEPLNEMSFQKHVHYYKTYQQFYGNFIFRKIYLTLRKTKQTMEFLGQ